MTVAYASRVPVGAAGVALAHTAHAADSCVEPDSESLRASLNYASQAAEPAASCAHCAFFTADAAGVACGACKIMSGPVDSTGHCDSFSPPA